jgi:hypothetical protein
MFKHFCSGILLTALISLAPAFGETNLVVNGGFENGTNGWADRHCSIEAVSTPTHSGSGSAKVFNRKETWQGIKQSMLGKMTNGNTYKISGWVRLESASSDTVTLSVELADEAGTKYINVNSVTANNSEWAEVSGEFTLEASGTPTTLDIYFEGPAPDVTFFVDDVTVYSVAAPAPAGPNEPNAPKAEPNAPPKKEPNTPPQKTAATVHETGADLVTESAETGTKHEAVLREG